VGVVDQRLPGRCQRRELAGPKHTRLEPVGAFVSRPEGTEIVAKITAIPTGTTQKGTLPVVPAARPRISSQDPANRHCDITIGQVFPWLKTATASAAIANNGANNLGAFIVELHQVR